MIDNKRLRILEGLGTEYFKKSFFTKEKPKYVYSKYKIPFGRVKGKDRIFYIDLTEACRMLFLGMTRSGKTFCLRSIADRINKIGYSVVFLPDVKNEFHTSNKPVQPKFRHLLLEGEEPRPMKIVTFRPTFFMELDRNKLPEDNYWLSLNPSKMSRADFFTLMNATKLTQPQQVILELIYENLSKLKDFKFEMLDEILDEIDEIQENQRLAMRFKFRPLKQSKFYIEKYERDLVKLIQKGYVISINMDRFNDFGEGSFSYPEVAVSIILRDMINARKQKKIPKLFIIVDEASRFIPTDKNPSCKRDFLESVDVDTAYNINYIFATQEITKIPEQIIKQCRYLFIPYSADVGTIKECLLLSGLARNIQVAKNQALTLKHTLRRFEWIAIDRVLGYKEIVQPLAPLSWHKETTSI